MAISFDMNIFGKKYFAVLFYEWGIFRLILNKEQFFLHGVPFKDLLHMFHITKILVDIAIQVSSFLKEAA